MAYAYIEQPWSGRRLTGLFGAIAVNVGFIVGISSGLSFQVPIVDPPRIIADIIDTVVDKPPEVIPQPLVPDPPPPIHVEKPEVVIEFPPELTDTPMVAVTVDPAPMHQAPAPIAHTQLQADPRHPLAQPIYPPTAIRRNQQGVVTLLIYVLPDGRVGDLRIKRSSGFPLLDEAAVAAAREGWRFRPATQGGAPVAAWGQYAVTFQLTGQD